MLFKVMRKDCLGVCGTVHKLNRIEIRDFWNFRNEFGKDFQLELHSDAIEEPKNQLRINKNARSNE